MMDAPDTGAINNNDIRTINTRKLLTALRGMDPVTKKDVADALNLSLPTITNICKQLVDGGYIRECGNVDSSIGRKPTLISLNKDCAYGVGVYINAHNVDAAIVNFAGDIIFQESKRIAFAGTGEYWTRIAEYANACIDKAVPDKSKVIGIRLAQPFLMDTKHLKDFGLKEVPVGMLDTEEIPSFFKYKTDVIQVTEAAGIPRIWYGDLQRDTVVVVLDRFIEGCLVQRSPVTNKVVTNVVPLGHMSMEYDGKPCYCGKRGCFQTYCATSLIADKINGVETLTSYYTTLPKDKYISIGRFFEEIDNGNAEYQAIWEDYVDKLAYALHNLHILFNADIVISGDITPYIAQHKAELVESISRLDPIAADFNECIHTSSIARYDTSVGAALSLCDSLIYKENLLKTDRADAGRCHRCL